MDYRLSFPDRPKNIKLPHFDRIQNEWIYAQNAYPPSSSTLLSIPAMLYGKLVSSARPTDQNDLMISLAESPWKRRLSEDNLFKDLQKIGFSSAVVGFYHPYCRIFFNNLKKCFFTTGNEFFKGSTTDLLKNSAINNLFKVSEILPFSMRVSLGVENQPGSVNTGIFVYEALLDRFFQFALDEDINFVYAHFSVPHRPFIFDAKKNHMISSSNGNASYFDNLKLVDNTLGKIRQYLEENNLWEKSIIIITSDHWWRMSKYYDSKSDHRVPFFVKLQYQKESLKYEPTFNNIIIRDLIIALFKNEFNAEQLIQWLDSHRCLADSPYNIELFSI